jgi:hypothetical protein
VTTASLKFTAQKCRLAVLVVQRWVRGYIACNHARMVALGRIWDGVASAHLAALHEAILQDSGQNSERRRHTEAASSSSKSSNTRKVNIVRNAPVADLEGRGKVSSLSPSDQIGVTKSARETNAVIVVPRPHPPAGRRKSTSGGNISLPDAPISLLPKPPPGRKTKQSFTKEQVRGIDRTVAWQYPHHCHH